MTVKELLLCSFIKNDFVGTRCIINILLSVIT